MSSMNDDDDDELPLAVDFDQFLASSTPPAAPALLQAEYVEKSSPHDSESSFLTSIRDHSEQSYDLDDLLEEAFHKYILDKPPFCIVDKGEKTRSVRLNESDQEVELAFRPWPGGQWGFWIYTDSIGDRYICRYDKGYYYVWEGVSSGFSKQAVAKSVSGSMKRDSSCLDGDQSLESGRSPSRSFRQRTARQQAPYAMCRLQTLNELKGVHATESQLEESLLARNRPTTKMLKQKMFVPQTSPAASPSSHETVVPLSGENVKVDPTSTSVGQPNMPGVLLRSRLDNDTGPCIPIYLSGVGSIEQLFHSIRMRWSFQLGKKPIRYCVAKFPWLNDNRSILLHTDNEDAYRLLCHEIQCAPGWKTGGQIDADLEVRTE